MLVAYRSLNRLDPRLLSIRIAENSAFADAFLILG